MMRREDGKKACGIEGPSRGDREYRSSEEVYMIPKGERGFCG
jgi:hypothetical protein